MEADLYEANKIIDEQIDIIKDLERKIDIKDEYCNLIWCLGVDYDGCNTIGSLKSLIDELVNYAKKAIKNDDKSIMAEGVDGKYFNILHEEVVTPKKED